MAYARTCDEAPIVANTVGADDGSELRVFLDGKEATALRKSGNVIASTSNTYLKQFEIQARTTGENLYTDNFRSVLYGKGEYFRADLNGTGYENFADAFAAAKDGDTVTLHEHMTEAVEINKALTVETNGKTFLYSSRKGGGIRATISSGTGFLLNHGIYKGTLHVGTASDGRTFDKENLSFSGACLLIMQSALVNVDLRNFVYQTALGDSQSLIESQIGNNTVTVTIDNCDLIGDVTNKALFGARTYTTDGGIYNITVTNSNLYTQCDNLVKTWCQSLKGTPMTIHLTLGKGTVLFAKENLSLSLTEDGNATATVILQNGVKLSHVQGADGISLADESAKTVHIAPATVSFGGKEFTVAYAVATDYATLTFKNGETVLAEELWAKGENPTKIRVALVDGYYAMIDNAEAITGDKTYEATAILSSVSKIKGNLTLYSALTLNFYIAKDSLAKTVKFADGKVVDLATLNTVTIGEQEYYLYQVEDKAPKDLVSAFTIEIGLGEIGTYTVKSSLVKYAASVLENESEIEEGKTLVKALLDYVSKTAQQFGTDASDVGITAINNLLTKHSYTMPGWTAKDIQTVTAGEVFKGAALNLDSMPGFLFFVADGFSGEITVKYSNTVKVYTKDNIKQYNTADGVKSAIRVDLHASEYRELITLTAGDETMTYNLDTYIQSQKGDAFVAPRYLQALYAYSVAAEAYLAAQN